MKKKIKLKYFHGFSKKEQKRLYKQAAFLEPYIYKDVDFSGARQLIEVGCGVGAQTAILRRHFPKAHITGIDASPAQLDQAEKYLHRQITSGAVELSIQDATHLDFASHSFDGAFICWFLEHVSEPVRVLKEVRRVLKPGAKVHCCEVHNASFFLDPYSPATLKYWFEFNDEQWMMKGDPFVGAKLGNLLKAAGFKKIEVLVKPMLFDSRWVKERSEFIRDWKEVLISGAPALLKSKRVTVNMVNKMKKELEVIRRSKNSVLYYTWIQACARA